MNWFEKLMPSRIRTENSDKKGSVPEGLWTKCNECNAVLYRAELERNQEVCPKCNHHMRIGARQRLSYFLDDDSTSEIAAEIEPLDFLKFRDVKKYIIFLKIENFFLLFYDRISFFQQILNL